jgi:hypothetical protein
MTGHESSGLLSSSDEKHMYHSVSPAYPITEPGQGGGGATLIKRPSFTAGKKIGTWMMVALIFFSVSGGPVGMEVAVKSGGPLLAIIGFILVPLIWSVPEAAMTAELSIAYPEVRSCACV